MILLIDNYDSFTYNLYHYILTCGVECTSVRSNEFSPSLTKGITGIVFSPGPQTPTEHPLMFQLLKEFSGKVPILGICLGFQAIGMHYGAKITKGPKPVHGKTSEITHNGHRAFHNIPSPCMVGRYHSLIITELENTQLEPLSWTADNINMSFAHKELPIWGHQFHPESIMTEHGNQMIQNWVRLTKEF